MALGLSLPVNIIPGASSLLAKVDGLKASFMSVPARVNTALDKLTIVRQAMARNGAPPSAQSDALTVEQHLRQVQSEWAASATDYQKLNTTGLSLSVDTLTTATRLLASAGYVLSNMDSLQASVDALAAKYLTAQQRQQVNAQYAGTIGGLSLGTLALIGVGAYLLIGA